MANHTDEEFARLQAECEGWRKQALQENDANDLLAESLAKATDEIKWLRKRLGMKEAEDAAR